MRLRLVLVACLLALAAVATHRPPLPTVATTPAPAPVVDVSAPVGPTTDSRAELVAGLERAAAVQRYVEAVKQNQADEAAAKAAAARHPAPTPTPIKTESAPTPAPVGSGDAETAVRAHFGDIFGQAWGVSGCESVHDPGAISPGGGNWGLFQINTVHRADFEAFTGHPWADVLNADLNAMYARKLYDGSGWGPWSCAWAAHSG